MVVAGYARNLNEVNAVQLIERAISIAQSVIRWKPQQNMKTTKSLLLATLLMFPTALCLASQLPTRGLWVQFERRGWSSEYWTGQVIQQFNDFDPVVGHTVPEEVA